MSLLEETNLEKPEKKENGFLACYPVFNEYHKCMTRFRAGDLSDLDEQEKTYFKNFTNCLFKDLNSLDSCR
jgi:hypothetical protein